MPDVYRGYCLTEGAKLIRISYEDKELEDFIDHDMWSRAEGKWVVPGI